MIILSIDSSTPVAGIAVADEQGLLGEMMVNTENTHSEKLLPMIVSLLEELKLKPENLDVVAIMQGPGSFTGLRIGMATAKGLVQGCGAKLVVVPTLDCMAYNLVNYPGLVCPVLNAQKKQVYTALYATEQGNWQRKSEYQAIAAEDLAEQLLELKQDVWFLGDGLNAYADVFQAKLGDYCHFAPMHQHLPRAAALAVLALEKAKQGEYADLYTTEPIYIRKSEAEVQWEMKHNTCSVQ